MGEIILNGKSYNSGMKYKEVTQAEYNTLPSSKLTDGTLYCITDAPGPGEGFPPMIYSYEEREVGVWVDGKPLYQKTITFTSTAILNINTWHTIADVSDLNIDILTDSLLRSAIDDYTTRAYISQVNDGNFKIFSLTSAGWLCDSAVLWYTKTTDIPGSGTWTTDGTYAKHYSTDEKVIGTWIDGKTLYEKIFVNVSLSSDAYTTNLDLNCVASEIIAVKMISPGSVVNTTVFLDNMYSQVDSSGSTTIIHPTASLGGNTMTDAKILVQYTKTTD